MPMMSEETTQGDNFATYEELADLELEFDQIEMETIRKQYLMSKDLYAKRKKVVAKIDSFWARALESAPQDIDQFIQPSDSQLLAECLQDIDVSRFELESNPETGNPRSVSIKFTFSDNEYFEDNVLEKKFWFRHASDGWTGLVSEPVKINWKKGKDLTQGLNDAAVKLWQAKQKQASASKGQADVSELPEYKALVEKLEMNDRSSTSFFTLFGYVSEYYYVSEEDSIAAKAKIQADKEKRVKGQKTEAVEPNVEAIGEHEEVEICPHGGDLALAISEDFWPGATKYFTEAERAPVDDNSDMESLDGFRSGLSDSDDEDDEVVDIRSLVRDKRKQKSDTGSQSPPASKNRKTA